MVTVQMTLDEKLVKRVDQVVHKLHTSRSAFTRQALQEAIKRYQITVFEQKHKAGYAAKPVATGEFDVFTDEQAWGDQ